MKPHNVLVLPGWQDSGPQHWQSRWVAQCGFRKVEQHDWQRPLRGDWITRLEDTLLSNDEPVVLVAHSLGCMLVASWAACSHNTHRVKAALLVAPGDVQLEVLRSVLPSWSTPALQKLPFQSIVVASQNDPYCSFARASGFAAAWGARLVDLGQAGHINAESGLADWPQGRVLLDELIQI